MSEIDKFWDMLFSDDNNIREIGLNIYDNFFKKNPNYTKNIINGISSDFYNIYNKFNFHDFRIKKIGFENQNLKLTIYDYYKDYRDYKENLFFEICYYNVLDYSISLKNKYGVSWSRDIFEKIHKRCYKHRIRLVDDSSIMITFKNISIREVSCFE